jgi:hypothetical protein
MYIYKDTTLTDIYLKNVIKRPFDIPPGPLKLKIDKKELKNELALLKCSSLLPQLEEMVILI